MGFMKKLKKLFKTPGGNDGAQGDDPDSDTDLPAAVGPDGDPASGPTTPRFAASPIKPKSQDGPPECLTPQPPSPAPATGSSAARVAAAAQHTRRRPPRHASLKHLLKLDKYHFMSDVNVLEAQRMMEAGTRGEADMQGSQASSRTSQGLPSDSTDSSHPSWRQGALHSPACASFGPDEWEASNILAVNPAVPPGMRRPAWSVGDFKLIKKLHQGYASDVYFARCRRTLELVVLKVYRLADQCDLQRVQLYREIRVHSRLQHQNIVQFYAAFLGIIHRDIK
ncbi:protein kinase domain-containing protein [Haematococcus lacustris]|uniref:Protein kinase domain-containing protein n=1 Tax=Haematococcus lacustris TaxID=44745 RepID=A0A699Z8H9_HAELA|nr:protein kinase domain-containing protein [Haematococcus lacustris]